MKKHSTIKHFLAKKTSKTKDKKEHKKDHRHRELNKKASDSKRMWEKFLNNTSSRNLIKRSWNSPNPQTEYKKTIEKLAKEFEKNKQH